MANPDPPKLSDQQRHELEAALLAALLMIHQGARQETLARVQGQTQGMMQDVPAPQRAALMRFVQDRTAKIQAGVNDTIDQAMAEDDPEAALAQSKRETDRYNATVLLPFMARTAETGGMLAAYEDTPAPDGNGLTLADTTLFNWIQTTDYEDECTAAMDASPATLDDLYSITGGPPPVHERCACSIEPA